MRIDPRQTASVLPSLAQPARPAGRETFRLTSDRAKGSGAARSSAPLATLDAILMLQGEEERGERKRRSARRGQDLLDLLDGLKAGLLSGTISTADLQRLSDRLALAAGPSGDVGLDAVIAHIELRVKVELAKLGRT